MDRPTIIKSTENNENLEIIFTYQSQKQIIIIIMEELEFYGKIKKNAYYITTVMCFNCL